MRRIPLLILGAVLLATASLAQETTPPAAAPTPGTTLTINPPTACTSSATCSAQIYYCAGAASACSLTGDVWTLKTTLTGLVSGTPAIYTDTSETLGSAATYTVDFTQGSTDSGPLPSYTGTPTAPLAGGSFSGTTS